MHFRAFNVFIILLLSALGVRAGELVAPLQLANQLQTDNAPLVLDVRTQAEFDAGHIPGAMLIPHDQLAERFNEVPADREVVVYCRSGRRATLAERVLADQGRKVSQLDGSWIGWRAAGLPAATTEQTP